ncbi:LOW QUALITY PROTEIN: uncharacterized protein si:ch211-13f8.1 [Colossoma macropomum]|uniref:LOW QUALITY PROTEIN: uncharacterized protein si:ch211-13f8.1 n=1 Tax=Colossoma macropomum TaxID=42526 RepID=UPI0018656986|nr:LOW QUALITY PROTEIN: uncharacterized protein si:ch211-13f8.1 [Colossoma macropomum]
MEGETPGASDSTSTALHISVERTADTQELLSTLQSESKSPSPTSCSPSSSPPLSGSAVSALQTKFKEISQRRCKEKDKHDYLCEVSLEHSVQKIDEDQLSPSQTPPTDRRKNSSSSDEDGSEPRLTEACEKRDKESTTFGVAGPPRGLGEGSSLENIATGGADTSLSPKPTSSPRHWAPPKGFWRVARPETLLLNGEEASSLVPCSPKNVPHAREEEFQRKRRLRVERVAVGKELQRSDSLESAFRRCFQKEADPPDTLADLWRADSWETLCSRGGSKMERAGTDEKHTEKCKTRTMETTTGKRAEGQQPPDLIYRGLPPSYKETDWDTAIITHGAELTVRSALSRGELTLSPRHEQAKRLLERARSKARSQNPDSDHATWQADREDLELLPMHESPPPHRTIIVATQEQLVPPPVQLLEVRGRNSERGITLRRHGQSPTRVRFEDESEKEAERRYLDRVRERGPVVAERSQSNQQPKAEPILTISQVSKGSGTSWGSVGIPVAILTDEVEGTSLETVVLKEDLRKCEACGSILAPVHAKESSSKSLLSSAEGKPAPRWVTPGHSSRQIIRPALLGGVMLTEGSNLAENVEVAAVGGAGERMSAFGKLRRRSRKGESRVETSYGPYARGQELLAQRRNSRTRSSLEEVTGLRSKQTETPTRGVTFAIDTLPGADTSQSMATTSRNARDSPGPQLPIKSALKSTSKSRPTGQRVVKLLPSVQYRLIHLDKQVEGGSHHQDVAPEEHLSVTLGTSSQASQATSGLTPCIRPSSLRYSSPVLTPELQALAIWDTVDPVDAHLSSDDVCRDSTCASPHPPECRPAVRGMGMSKAEDLRAELLRAEHRKAELQWDENLGGSRRSAEREGKPKLSLRRFFSAMGLNSMGKLVKGNRSSSMEQLSSPALKHSSASPSPTHKGQPPLQRTPSLQSLHTESPLAQLRKVSSVQSLQSPKRKFERSTILGELPLPLSLGPRELQVEGGMEHLDGSRSVGPLGRLVQAFPDGTLLLELKRPANGPFGFVISRGKGRPDSGIYVEQVGGSPTDNVYTGLLGVGDEILEVNGEKVTGLNLDQVTRLMTRESTATIRILPHRWIQH